MLAGSVIFLVIIFIVFVLEIFRELCSFRIVRYDIHSAKFAQGEFTPQKVLFLSDLHNQCYGKENDKLLEAIRKESPDMILVGGDMLVGKDGCNFAPALQFVGNLTCFAPVYYVNGNHEQRMRDYPQNYGQNFQRYKAQLERTGVRFLENSSICIDQKGGRLCIHGLEIPKRCYTHFGKPPLTQADIVQSIGTSRREEYNILLAHNPCYVEDYVKWGADLILSGHLHGGIIRIPGFRGLVAPNWQFFPKYSGGKYKVEETDVVVSKGLGTHTVRIRLFNPAELIVLTLSE